jgi:hypothetical protein
MIGVRERSIRRERVLMESKPGDDEWQRSDAALGAGIIRNDYWLQNKIFTAQQWARGSAEELLDGSAWQDFARRIARLGERVQAAGPADRAEGYRHAAMLLRNGLDMAIEDFDPDHPHIHWWTRRFKLGWDCPDALYGISALRGDASYRVSGSRGSVRFLGFQVMDSGRTVGNTHDGELEPGPDGSFELLLSRGRQPGNWLPLSPSADSLLIRQFSYDWNHEQMANLWIERIDAGPRAEPSDGRLAPAVMARWLDGVARHVEDCIDVWLEVDRAIRERLVNVFPATNFGGAAAGAQPHQWAGCGAFRLRDDEALIIEVVPPRARYWSFHLGNLWCETLDLGCQTSLNGHQAVLDADGAFRAVIAAVDPGVPNWLDTTGRAEGSMVCRWNTADRFPVPECRLVKLASLRDQLPPGTPVVTPAQRRAVLDARREGLRRRWRMPFTPAPAR